MQCVCCSCSACWILTNLIFATKPDDHAGSDSTFDLKVCLCSYTLNQLFHDPDITCCGKTILSLFPRPDTSRYVLQWVHVSPGPRTEEIRLKIILTTKFPTSLHGSPRTYQTSFYGNPRKWKQNFAWVNRVPVTQNLVRKTAIWRSKYFNSDILRERTEPGTFLMAVIVDGHVTGIPMNNSQ